MFEDLKIIYLEDEPIVALDTSEHLAALGFRDVKVASKLSSAETLVADENFDVALFDINVDRGQTSLALGEEIAARGTKVIFASGNSSASHDIEKKGMLFLDKPFSPNQLTSILEKIAGT